MTRKTISPTVLVPLEAREGKYDNAFRILRDGGSQWLLDFLVYKEKLKRATVVVRVRVDEAMLPAIRDRLNETLRDVSAPLPQTTLTFEALKEVS